MPSESTSSITRMTGEAWDRALRFLRAYHAYEVVGAEHVGSTGPYLVASTHSLATYENFLLSSVCVEQTGRRPHIVGDDLIFKVPGMASFARTIGLIPRGREVAIDLLRRGEIVGLGPGGMRESIRSSRHKYEFTWEGRLGFVWVALLAGAPIVLAACPRADDIYSVYESPLTRLAYDQLKVPFPIFRGLGLTAIPRPVKLVHVLDEPVPPPVPPEEVTEEIVVRHHAYLVERMRALMDVAKRLG